MDQSLLQKIAAHYVALHLNPKQSQVLNPQTITLLGSELEAMLGHYLLPRTLTSDDSQELGETNISPPEPGAQILSILINYNSLYRYAEQQCELRGKSSNSVTRLQRLESALRDREINTYGDLVLCGQDRSWIRHGNIRDPFRIPNLGSDCLKIFYSFLNQQKIEIFNTPYRSEELMPPSEEKK